MSFHYQRLKIQHVCFLLYLSNESVVPDDVLSRKAVEVDKAAVGGSFEAIVNQPVLSRLVNFISSLEVYKTLILRLSFLSCFYII